MTEREQIAAAYDKANAERYVEFDDFLLGWQAARSAEWVAEAMRLADKHAEEHRKAALSCSGFFMDYITLKSNELDARAALEAHLKES